MQATRRLHPQWAVRGQPRIDTATGCTEALGVMKKSAVQSDQNLALKWGEWSLWFANALSCQANPEPRLRPVVRTVVQWAPMEKSHGQDKKLLFGAGISYWFGNRPSPASHR